MRKQRQQYSGDFKAKVALEAIKGFKSTNQIAQDFQIHPQLVTQWKKHLLEAAPSLMADKRSTKEKSSEDLTNQLYQQIGQLKVELDWLKKKSGLSP